MKKAQINSSVTIPLAAVIQALHTFYWQAFLQTVTQQGRTMTQHMSYARCRHSEALVQTKKKEFSIRLTSTTQYFDVSISVERTPANFVCCRPQAGFSLSLLFNTGIICSIFFGNIGWISTDHTVPYPIRYTFSGAHQSQLWWVKINCRKFYLQGNVVSLLQKNLIRHTATLILQNERKLAVHIKTIQSK